MKKTVALILAVLFVAASFSGCNSPNLGFTLDEFSERLTQRIQEDGMDDLKLGEWNYNDFTSVNPKSELIGEYVAKLYPYLFITVRCANGKSGPITYISVELVEDKETVAPPYPDFFSYLARVIFGICEPDATAEETQDYEDTLITKARALNKDTKDGAVWYLEDHSYYYRYSITYGSSSFYFSVRMREYI